MGAPRTRESVGVSQLPKLPLHPRTSEIVEPPRVHERGVGVADLPRLAQIREVRLLSRSQEFVLAFRSIEPKCFELQPESGLRRR